MCDRSSTAPAFAPHRFRSDGENPGADHSISAQLISKHVSRTSGNVQVEHVVRFTAARFKYLRYSRGYSFPPLQFTINDYQPIRIFLFLSLNWWATHFVCQYCLQNGAMDKNACRDENRECHFRRRVEPCCYLAFVYYSALVCFVCP